MSETGTSKARDVTGAFRFASPGLAVTWCCPHRAKPKATAGRRIKFTKAWGRTYVCADCAKELSK